MSYTRGARHDYLGMTLDFSEKGTFGVSMIPYIDSIHADFPETLRGSAPTPHAGNLLRVRDEAEAKFLPEEQAVMFHHSVAQLLFLSMRARRDIQLAVSFLTGRVKRPDKDDWGKLRRVLLYLKGTRLLSFRITIDNLSTAHWYVDAAHAVHDDCCGQTGAGMTLGKGAALCFSWKQKSNTKSSTEMELVGVNDAISIILWSLYFIRAQGYDMSPHATIFQDNKSAILLEVNGRTSSSKRTKHIKSYFYFVKDKVEDGDVVVQHKPTEDMWIDVNTKPKIGYPFRLDRSHIMNCPIDIPDETL